MFPPAGRPYFKRAGNTPAAATSPELPNVIPQDLPSTGEGAWTGSRTPTHTVGEPPCLDLWSAPKKTGGSTEPHSGAPPAAPPREVLGATQQAWGAPKPSMEGRALGTHTLPTAPTPCPEEARVDMGQRLPPSGTAWDGLRGAPSSLSSSPGLPPAEASCPPCSPWDLQGSCLEQGAALGQRELCGGIPGISQQNGGAHPEFQTPGPGLGAVCSARDQWLGLGTGEGHWS